MSVARIERSLFNNFVAMANPLLHRLELDEVLIKFKVYGRYHAITSVYLTLGMVLEYMWYCNYVFVADQVNYRCVDFTLDLNATGSNKSRTQNTTIDWCQNPDSCTKWVYDNPNSFVAEFELACQEWKRTSIGSVHNFGYMTGVFIVGLLSDRFGRKTLTIITGVAAGILGPAKSFVTHYWLYVVIEFLEAAIGDFSSPIYMLAIEIVAYDSRVSYTSICNTGLGLGGMVLPLLAWLIPYWRTLVKVLYLPALLSVFLIYLLDESPRWLLTKGKKKEAIKIIKKAAKMNKMELEENLQMITYEKDNGANFATAIADTFKSKALMKRFFVCLTWWIASTFVNYGLIINSMLLDGNKYVNFSISAAMKTLSMSVAAYVIHKLNRKGPLIFCFVICAVLCLVQPFIPNGLLWLQITNYMVGVLLSSMCFCITYIFTSELFPTESRNSMHGLCSSIGRIGSIIAPYTPLLTVYWTGLPPVLFGAVSLTAGLLTILVPETADQNLPDTVLQAEKMETSVAT